MSTEVNPAYQRAQQLKSAGRIIGIVSVAALVFGLAEKVYSEHKAEQAAAHETQPSNSVPTLKLNTRTPL